jgi:flagellar hook-associated protein 1 FlgK
MPGIFDMMDISRWALNAAAAQLDVTSHNVANVNTEGYSRQEVVQATRPAEYTSDGWYGSGVQVVTVIQRVDQYLQAQITSKISDSTYHENRLSQLLRLETLSNEAGESGLGEDLTAFFNAWQDLSNNPQSEAVRQVLNETANNLVARFQSIGQDLINVERDLDGYLKAGVEEINSICKALAELNDKISAAEVGGHTANDFRDERQRLLNDLAEYVPIQWFEDNKGSVTVITGRGLTLVQDLTPAADDEGPLAWEQVDGTGDYQVVWTNLDLALTTEDLDGGKMGAWLTVRDQDIVQMQDFMNDLASTVIWEVNLQHSQGAGLSLFSDALGDYEVDDITAALNSSAADLEYGSNITSGSFDIWVYEGETRRGYTVNFNAGDSLEDIRDAINATLTGTNDPVASITPSGQLRLSSPAGVEFAFANEVSSTGSGPAGLLAALGINTYFSGDDTLNIDLNSVVTDNVGLIAAGRLLSDGEHAPGDNSNALDLADLKDSDTMNGRTETFNEAIINWSAELGTDVSAASDNYSFALTTYTELQEQRDNVSAVSLDEEMVKMIKYQRAYQMAAKLITAADEMLLTLIQLKS